MNVVVLLQAFTLLNAFVITAHRLVDVAVHDHMPVALV